MRVSGMIWSLDQERLLLVQQGRPSSPRWMLPGGGVDPGESLTVALARELKEELGCRHCTVAEPSALVESIAPESHPSGRHLVHVVFRVEVPDEEDLATGRDTPGDPAVHEVRWVSREEVLRLPLHPPISKYLAGFRPGGDFEYFGPLWAP